MTKKYLYRSIYAIFLIAALLISSVFPFSYWDTPNVLAALPGGTLDPLTIPKFVTPLVIPPVMPNDGTENSYDIAVRQFQQQILPSGMPATTVWSYGSAADVTPALAPDPASSFNYPAFTIETQANTPVNVRWINDLVDASGNYLQHLLPVDQTLHWANPPATGCMNGSNTTDCHTDNPAPYAGPVPIVTHLHGAHDEAHSDGFPEAWWLPAANNIPAGYSMKGSLFDDSTGTNPGNLGYVDYSYRNDQPATTLWYHDHTLGMTRVNVYAGPAGFWMIRGGAYDGAKVAGTANNAILPGPAPVAGQGLAELNTPGNPVRDSIREIPLVIQDRSFNADGSLFYPPNRAFFDGYPGPYIPQSDISPTWNPEAFFNTIVVNGKTWPTFDVAPALYRFRILNGSNSRVLNLALIEVVNNVPAGQELPFYQIGAEQGFLPQVTLTKTGSTTPLIPGQPIPAVLNPTNDPQQALLVALAERADVIVDFRGLASGTKIRMVNTGPDMPFGGFPAMPADPNTTGQVMEFVVNASLDGASPTDPASGTPATNPENLSLNAEPGLGAVNNVRQISLNEAESNRVCVSPTDPSQVIMVFPTAQADIVAACAALNAVPMAPRMAMLGKVDLTNPGMPIGIPLVWNDTSGQSTQVPITMQNGTTKLINVSENPRLNDTEEWEIYNFTVDAHPIHPHMVRFEVVSRTPIPGIVPAPVSVGVLPNEQGFKDTVIAYPGEITKVKAKFDIAGLYVWHCHILEHEDNEMMRPYVVSAGSIVPGEIRTSLVRDTTGGSNPIVKAKWEANQDMYTDGDFAAGAQFMPSGQYQVNKTLSMCAVVTDPDGLADISNVYADVFYPTGTALGSSHVPLPGQSGDGCGALMQENSLSRLDKAQGIDLFCNQLRNNNNNLPIFNTGFNYDELCRADGELMKETAAVYCGTRDLSYEDPAGDYSVLAVAQDKVGLQGVLRNNFTYVPVTAFETDFTAVNYGAVRLNTHKILSGDLVWDTTPSAKPSIRNIGNTRLLMNVSQDDMGLGMTDQNWNVRYDARVGSNAQFVVYDPNVKTDLVDALDLSEMDEMDFSIDISKFPPTHTGDDYNGIMTLGATMAPHLVCQNGQL